MYSAGIPYIQGDETSYRKVQVLRTISDVVAHALSDA